MSIQPRFIKSFNNGQITIPKEVRDFFGMKHEFWLKLYIKEHKIIAEPIQKAIDREEYKNKLLALTTPVTISWEEIVKNRKQIDEQMKKRAL